MNAPQACLFDLDGVLLDTESLHSQAWSEAARNFGAKLTTKQLMLLKGRRRQDCLEKLIDWIDHPVPIERLRSVHRPISMNLLKEAKPMPGAEKLIEWCFYNNLPMALVTSSSSESVAFKCHPHPWLNKIKVRVLGDDKNLLSGKPSPDPYLLAAQKLGVKTKLCWAIEDSQSGCKSALDAKCKVWLLRENKDVLNTSIISTSTKLIDLIDLNLFLQTLKEVCLK